MNTKVSQLYGVGLDVEIRRINMRLDMVIQKKNDGLGLKNLMHIMCNHDKSGAGCMEREQFEKALRAYK